MLKSIRKICFKACVIAIRQSSSLAKNDSQKFWKSIDSYARIVGGTLNDVTGYSLVAKMKENVRAADDLFEQCKHKLDETKARYETAISKRNQLQKEMNGLLQRKSAWSDSDMLHFTELYKKEHLTESEELESQQYYRNATKMFEEAQTNLLSSIRERYIEEQNWSDKIRQTATWYTWALMLIHIGLFLTVQMLVEPKRRQEIGLQLNRIIDSKLESIEKLALEKNIQPPLPNQTSPSTPDSPASDAKRSTTQWNHYGVVMPQEKQEYMFVALGSICGAAITATLIVLKRALFD